MRAVIGSSLVLVLVLSCQAPGAQAKPSPASGAAAGIAAFLPEAKRFVEHSRGLRFRAPVKVEYLDDATFAARLLSDQGRYRASTDREAILLRAVGLLDPSVDAELALESLLKAGVIGFYDPRRKELAVRGTEATVQVRHALIHELTHALQDQWFNIDTPDDMEGDSELAFKSVLEGDARRIEQMYIAGLPAADREAIQREGDGGLPAGIPPVLIQELGFPYQAGAGFLQVLEQNGGQARIDSAFRKPPVATAQVMQPARFLAGFQPVAVPAPDVDGRPTSRGVFGEFRLALVFGSLVTAGLLSAADARAALSAWSGDSFATWLRADHDCVHAGFVASGPDGEAALVNALRKFAASRPGTTVDAGSLQLTSCAA